MSESIRFNASLNTAGFDSGAARLQQAASQASSKVSASFASMGASIAGVIAPFVGLYAAVNSVKNALDMGGRLNDLSKTTGETAGNLALLQRAFDNTGIGAEKVGVSIQKMSEFIVGLQQGSPAASKAADALGVSMADLAGKTPIAQMQALMAALADIRDPALRSATAVDVFGKAGRDIVPLAQDFGGAMAEARGELGSLPRILDKNSASLDELGDKLTNSVGSKLTELAVGLTAGVTGAKDLASALADIDAAGFGEKIGNSIRAAFAAPQEYVMAIGEFLLAGVLKAANALNAAMRHAVNVYFEMMQNPGFWSGFFGYIEAGFAKAGAVFTTLIAEGIKSVLSAMDWNPLWKPFTGLAKDALDNITAGIKDAGIAAENRMDASATRMKAAWNGATASSKYVYEDTFGAEQHLQKAREHLEKADQAAANMKDSSSTVAENFGKGSAAISDALDKMRGFDLGGESGEPFKLGYSGSENFPTSAGPGAPSEAESGGGNNGGSGSGGRGGRAYKEPMSASEYATELKAAAAAERYNNIAQRYESIGRYNSAGSMMERADRAAQRVRDNAAVKDYIQGAYGVNNMGEAYREHERGTSISRRMSEQEFRDYVRNRAITENEQQTTKQGAQTKDENAGQGSSGKNAEALATESTLKLILNKIQERPILVA